MITMQERFSEVKRGLQEDAPEHEILTAARHEMWDDLLELVGELDHPVETAVAALCLESALQSAPVEVFCHLLDCLPEMEYTGSCSMDYIPGEQRIEVDGTLLTLAAAQGKAAQLRALLDCGWDVNSASLDAARQLMRFNTGDLYFHAMMQRFTSSAVRPESCLRQMKMSGIGMMMPVVRQIHYGVTPLAAAIICGQAECVRILLEHGAWREEASSVSQALILRDREEDEPYQTCCCLVRNWDNTPRPLALAEVIRSILPEQLEQELLRCPYDPEQVAQAVYEVVSNARMTPNRGHWKEEKERDIIRLQVLERHYPEVLRRPELVSLLLRWSIVQNNPDDCLDFILPLCPERVDLSLIQEGWLRCSVRKTREILLRICEGRTCVMDRDSLPGIVPVTVLNAMLDHVEFLPPSEELGISSLSCAILETGNLRLIRKALETGAIPAEESTEWLLRYQSGHAASATIRTMLLTLPRKRMGTGEGFPLKKMADRIRFRWQPPFVRQQGYEALLEEDCPHDLAQALILQGLHDYRPQNRYHLEDGVWEAESPLNLLCWKGKADAVEAWVCRGSKKLLRRPGYISPAGMDYFLHATPLCIAAFSGQKQVVERLLALGAEAEEQRVGMPSTISWNDTKERLPLTPLLAAMVGGHWEIARLLQERGVTCDLQQQTVERLWKHLQTKDLHQTVQVRLAGTF